jgi:hypothetical protein
MRRNFVAKILILSSSATVLSVVPALALQVVDGIPPAPGPIPGAGVLSYVAIGLVGLGATGLKRLRRNRNK